MAETDYAQFEHKTPGDRTVMHVLYGLHTVAWASMGTLAVIALIINYIKRGDEVDCNNTVIKMATGVYTITNPINNVTSNLTLTGDDEENIMAWTE